MSFNTLGEIFNQKSDSFEQSAKNRFFFNIASYYVTRGSCMLAAARAQCGSRYVISQSGCVVVSQCVVSSFGLPLFTINMVNYCVCGGCTNSSLSGHRVHRFPNREQKRCYLPCLVPFCAAEETGLLLCDSHQKRGRV